MNSAAQALDALDGLVYGDLFDCAVTLDELTRFSRLALPQQELERLLNRPAVHKWVCRSQGLFCLRGREHLLQARVDSQQRARILRRQADRLARYLQYLPFVRGILLTGSVAAGAAGDDADIDLLVIVAPRRISVVFLLLGSFARLTRRRLFCPNYYLSEENLQIERRDFYVAREIAQAIALAGAGCRMLKENTWVREMMPNAVPLMEPVPGIPGASWCQRLLEWPCRGRLGDLLEKLLSQLSLRRLQTHYRGACGSLPAQVLKRFLDQIELRFHNPTRLSGILGRYQVVRQSLQGQLEGDWEHE